MQEEALLKVIGDYSVEVANLRIQLEKKKKKNEVLSQRLEELEEKEKENDNEL